MPDSIILSARPKKPHLVIVHDESSEPPFTGGHDPRAEMLPLSAVEVIAHILADLGFMGTHTVSTKQLAALLAVTYPRSFDAAFNLAAGTPSKYRYAQTPLILESLNLPYSGNDPFLSLLCRDKYRLKELVRAFGVSTPPALFVDEVSLPLLLDASTSLFPAIVKPNYLGGSIGIGPPIAHNPKAAAELIKERLPDYSEGLLVERFVPGMEVTVLVLGSPPTLEAIPLGLVQYSGQRLPGDFIWGYDQKMGSDLPVTWAPLEQLVPRTTVDACTVQACEIVERLRLRDFCRIDFRVQRDGAIFFLECNAQPNLSPDSSYIKSLNGKILNEINGVQKRYVSAALTRFGYL